MNHYFLNGLILDARAEIQKYFWSFFGSNENFKVCFQDQLTFTEKRKSSDHYSCD